MSHIQCRHLKHLSSSLGIGSRNNRRMKIVKTSLVKEFVNSNRHMVTNTEYSSKRIGTRAQMSYFAQELHRVPFLLQRISIVANTQYLNFPGLHFHLLTGTYRLHHLPVHTQASPRSDLFQHLFIERSQIDYNLHIIYCRTVIQCNKVDLFTTSAGANPPFYVDFSPEIITFQQVNNFCSTDFFHNYFLY